MGYACALLAIHSSRAGSLYAQISIASLDVQDKQSQDDIFRILTKMYASGAVEDDAVKEVVARAAMAISSDKVRAVYAACQLLEINSSRAGPHYRTAGRDVRSPIGHPQCTQGEFCEGSPSDRLLQHKNPPDGGPGDVYCEKCWNKVKSIYPDIDAVLLVHPSCTQKEDCLGSPADPLWRHWKSDG